MRSRLTQVAAVTALALLLAVVAPWTGAASAAAAVTVRVNGFELPLEAPALLVGGRVFVPLRGVFDRLGAAVSYDADTGRITVTRGPVVLRLRPGAGEAARNGRRLSLDAAPFLRSGRTYVPVRFVADALGEQVRWLAARRIVEIESTYARLLAERGEAAFATGEAESTDAPRPVIPYTDEELALLVRLINAEAYGQPYAGKVAVGAVVVNRVRSSAFPATIREVIYQPGQFTVVANGQINRPVREGARAAAREALLGADPSNGALFFFNPDTARSRFLFTRPVTARIGDHVFAR